MGSRLAIVALALPIAMGCRKNLCAASCPEDERYVEQCKKTTATWEGQPCRAERMELEDCAKPHTVCSKGSIDETASFESAKTACASQLATEKTCCATHATSHACLP
jgi:hypothetical protein